MAAVSKIATMRECREFFSGTETDQEKGAWSANQGSIGGIYVLIIILVWFGLQEILLSILISFGR